MSIDALIEANTADDAPADDAPDFEGHLDPDAAAEPGDDDDYGDEPDDDTEPAAAGAEDNPLAIGDLDEKTFIRIKSDGEELVVSQRELANGYIREKSFNRRVNELRDETKRAGELVDKSKAANEKLKSDVHSLFANPERCFAYMSEHFPNELEKVARTFAERFAAEEAMDPRQRERLLLQRRDARHKKQLVQERTRRQELEAKQTRDSNRTAFQAAIEAPHREAFVEAGSPTLEKAAQAAFRQEANELFEAIERRTRRLPERDEIRRIFSLLYARHGTAAAAETPAPAAPPTPRRAAPRTRRRGRKEPRALQESPDGSWDMSHLTD